jgi:hypothetical protein
MSTKKPVTNTTKQQKTGVQQQQPVGAVKKVTTVEAKKVFLDDTPVAELLDAIEKELGADLTEERNLFQKNKVLKVSGLRSASEKSWEKWDLPTGVADAIKSKLGLQQGSGTDSDFFQSVKAFWTNLPFPTKGKILPFPSVNPFLSVPSKLIVIRTAYKDIAKTILDSDDKTNFLICGNPGIGKSLFLYYLMARLKSLNEPVIFHSQFTPKVYLFLPGEVKVYDSIDPLVDDYLMKKNVWYLVDTGKDFKANKAKTVFVSSPKRSHYSEYVKSENHRTLYMPVWEHDELELCRSLLYSNIDQNKFEERLAKLGGIPRLIFENDLDPSVIVTDALTRTSLENCTRAVGEIYSNDNVSHVILQLVPTADYIGFKVMYLSVYIAEQVASRYAQANKGGLITFLLASDDLPNYGNLRGYVFEGYCHNIISAGGSFSIRSLEPGATQKEELQIPKCTKLFAGRAFDSAKQGKNNYYRPVSRNFGAVDAWIQSVGFFQITVNAHHGIKVNEMKNCLPYCREPNLYFVVPSGMFSSFKKQNFLTAQGTVAKNITRDLPKLKQFVMSVELDGGSSLKRKAAEDTSNTGSKKAKK